MKKINFLTLISVIFITFTACDNGHDPCVAECHQNNPSYSRPRCEDLCYSGNYNNDNTNDKNDTNNGGGSKDIYCTQRYYCDCSYYICQNQWGYYIEISSGSQHVCYESDDPDSCGATFGNLYGDDCCGGGNGDSGDGNGDSGGENPYEIPDGGDYYETSDD